MSFDLRRCSKEDLDRLNEQAKIWRERDNPAKEDVPAVARDRHSFSDGGLAEAGPPVEAIPTVPAFARATAGKQLNLFGEAE